MNLSSDQLAAFAAVVRTGSFTSAATQLHVTRSAVSQRVKHLEEAVGRLLVVRGTPCIATDAGRAVFRYATQSALLEHDVLTALRASEVATPSMTIAVNADSLATWFLDALAPLDDMGFELEVEDQDHSSTLLHEGRVMAAVTADVIPVQGCASVELGSMRYRAVASPAFVARHFPRGLDATALLRAPVVIYNERDDLQARFIRRFTRRQPEATVIRVPASHPFLEATRLGLGWAMQPESLARPLLAEGALIDLAPRRPLDVKLHWQHWQLEVDALSRLTASVKKTARAALRR